MNVRDLTNVLSTPTVLISIRQCIAKDIDVSARWGTTEMASCVAQVRKLLSLRYNDLLLAELA